MFIKKFVKILLFYITFNSYSHLADIVITLDTSEIIGTGPMQSSALLNLCEKAVPLLVSPHIAFIIAQLIINNDNKIKKINLEDFEIYKSKIGDFFLFIPKNYKESQIKKYLTAEFIKKVQEEKVNYSPLELVLGFDFFLFQKIDKKEFLEVKDNTKVLVTPYVSSTFIKGKSDIFPLWNIYLTGHGIFSENLTKNVSFQKLIKQETAEESQIAGLVLNQFRSFIEFLTTKLNVNLLYYLSCYAGDINMILPFMTNLINSKGNIIGNIQKPNFNIVTGSLTSAIVQDNAHESLEVCNNLKAAEKVDKIISFSHFFDNLRKYTDDKRNIRTIFTDKQLAEIFNTITPFAKSEFRSSDIHGISALPSIMFPNTDTFRAIPLNDKIAILSNVELKKSILDKKPIVFTNKNVILIYPTEIPSKIIINNEPNILPSIVSMQPGINIIKIDSLETTTSLKKLTKSFGALAPAFNKYFYIKELTSENNKFTDLFIVVKKVGEEEIVNVEIMYIQNGKIYSISQYERELQANELLKVVDDQFINALLNYFEININKEKVKKNFDYEKLIDILPEYKQILNRQKVQMDLKKYNEQIQQQKFIPERYEFGYEGDKEQKIEHQQQPIDKELGYSYES